MTDIRYILPPVPDGRTFDLFSHDDDDDAIVARVWASVTERGADELLVRDAAGHLRNVTAIPGGPGAGRGIYRGTIHVPATTDESS